MNPDVSRAAAYVRNVLQLSVADPRYDKLIAAAEKASSVSDLPGWAIAALPAHQVAAAYNEAGSTTRVGNPNHAPAGSPTGGQFTSKGAGSSGSSVRRVSAPNRRQPTIALRPAPKPATKPAQPAAAAHLPNLKAGGKNDPSRVKQLQTLIADLRLGQLTADGTYGPQTEAAVKAVQTKLGMKPTGQASTALIKKLQDAHTLSPCVSKAAAVHASAPAEPFVYDEDDYDGDGADAALLRMASAGDRVDLMLWDDDTVWIVGDDDTAELALDDAEYAAKTVRDLEADLDWLAPLIDDPDGFADAVEQLLAERVAAALGHDTTPGHDELHHYWTRGPGLAKWQPSPTPWTTLRQHLLKYMPLGEATRAASKWFHEVMGFWSGSDLNRVMHGHPPRGKIIGPG
jgi:peptidoglycan hydrolase-like protein with peptidoglycan-binding domain